MPRIDETQLVPRADGILYDELWPISHLPTRAALIARKLVWETEFIVGEDTFCGTVIAATLGEADAIADARGLGEKVIGYWSDPEN